MTMKIAVWAILLAFVTTIWAPTCGMGPGGTTYHLDDAASLGLPVQYSNWPVIGIYNLTDNSPIEEGLGYHCYSESDCVIDSAKGYQGNPDARFQNFSRVLLKVNDSGSERAYYADIRYNGSGGMATCGGPVYRIENITPAQAPDFTVFLVGLTLIVAICGVLFIVQEHFKKTNRKSKRD